MRTKHGATCVRSAGSHGVCDLLCGNGEEIFAVQVKGGRKPRGVSWPELEEFAVKFKAVPLVLYKPDYGPFTECRSERELAEACTRRSKSSKRGSHVKRKNRKAL